MYAGNTQEFSNVRREKWCKHLKKNGLEVKELLSDIVHLNAQGCELYARLIGEELVRAPELGDNPIASALRRRLSRRNGR